MKKRSFFERLAGNLRFDDSDDNVIPIENKSDRHQTVSIPEKRQLPIGPNPLLEDKYPSVATTPVEEVGELPVDVYETPTEIIIQTLIAGVMPENLSIDITRDIVSISGKREENKSISEESYHTRELYWGAFERTVTLPEEIEIDTAEAIERHGMLVIKLPKIDKRRKTMLKIKSI